MKIRNKLGMLLAGVAAILFGLAPVAKATEITDFTNTITIWSCASFNYNVSYVLDSTTDTYFSTPTFPELTGSWENAVNQHDYIYASFRNPVTADDILNNLGYPVQVNHYNTSGTLDASQTVTFKVGESYENIEVYTDSNGNLQVIVH